MLGIPTPTRFDLNFSLFGIPIRVSPFFWLLAVVVGYRFGSGADRPEDAGVIAACVFLSVLVHELGHGLTARICGDRPWIVLHGFGGVCVSDRERRSFGQRLLIVVMGPASGLLLAAGSVAGWVALVAFNVPIGPEVELALMSLLILNVVYSLFNLLPIWPMDGGQLVMAMLDHLSPRHGTRRAHILSFLASGTGAAIVGVWGQGQWIIATIWLGYFAFVNFVLLSHYHRIALAEREGY
jgi:Zn-dependent protease